MWYRTWKELVKDGRVNIIKTHYIDVCKQVQGIYFYLKYALEFKKVLLIEIIILHHKKLKNMNIMINYFKCYNRLVNFSLMDT